MNLDEIGIIPQKIQQFNRKDIFSVEDLLDLTPRDYVDYRQPKSLLDINDGDKCVIVARLISLDKKIASTGRQYLQAVFEDCTSGNKFKCFWFNALYLYNQLYISVRYAILGKFTKNKYTGLLEVCNPDMITKNLNELVRILPKYPTITGMSNSYLNGSISDALYFSDIAEIYSNDILSEYGLPTRKDAFTYKHKPETMEQVELAKKRFIFEELYNYASILHSKSEELKKASDIVVSNKYLTDAYIESLPYTLTSDQQTAIDEIIEKMSSGNMVNALVQGDVGCGKTSVAIALMCACVSSGYQSVLMAPTVVVATQHYEGLLDFATSNNKTVALLTSAACYLNDTKLSKAKVLKQIESGSVDFIVGTHSVLSDAVKYNNLGIVIIDEEHKFGVVQKEKLIQSDKGIHCITMSATPIPRSIAMSLYAELMDIYFIESLPNGRKPINTYVSEADEETFNKMEEELKKGHQCYMVCRLITPSKNEDLQNQDSIEKMAPILRNRFKGYNIGIITGKMKQTEIDAEMLKFKNNEYQILLATTIIEVGVNVPNATVINIRNYEWMGLAGLHQLRGRVGRSNLQGYCILSKSMDFDNGRNVLCKTTNGFEIAEEDLNLRGMGELAGTKQSGVDRAVMTAITYPDLFARIKKTISEKK